MPSASFGPIRVGAAAVDITPSPGCWLAGFGPGRAASAAHDPLWARALAISAGESTFALVTLDTFAVLGPSADTIAHGVPGLAPDHVAVCATHTHSGPDLLGLWGPDSGRTGVDEAVHAQAVTGAIDALRRAVTQQRPARLTFARADTPVRTAVNVREPESLDGDIAILRACDAGTGAGLATLVNWSCHPEVLQQRSTVLSSDLADPLRRRLEADLGGVALFANGSLGARVTVASADDSHHEAQRVGESVADAVSSAVSTAERSVDWSALNVATEPVVLPLEGLLLRDGVARGVITPAWAPNGRVATRVTACALGPATLLAVPGEPQPALGKRWKRMMRRAHRFLVSLAHDEIGNVLRGEDYHLPPYRREALWSLGPETAGLLTMAVQRALARVE